ncbi:MAG: hypothetical protein ACOH2A_09470 [Sphingobacteriaceae bacterium]
MEDAIITLECNEDPNLLPIIHTRLKANEISCFNADLKMIGIIPLFNQMPVEIKRKIFERNPEKCCVILSKNITLELSETTNVGNVFVNGPNVSLHKFDMVKPRQINEVF